MGKKDYTFSADMWSLGCIYAEMLQGRSLFFGMCEIDQLFQIYYKLGTPTAEEWPGFDELPFYQDGIFPYWKVRVSSEGHSVELDYACKCMVRGEAEGLAWAVCRALLTLVHLCRNSYVGVFPTPTRWSTTSCLAACSTILPSAGPPTWPCSTPPSAEPEMWTPTTPPPSRARRWTPLWTARTDGTFTSTHVTEVTGRPRYLRIFYRPETGFLICIYFIKLALEDAGGVWLKQYRFLRLLEMEIMKFKETRRYGACPTRPPAAISYQLTCDPARTRRDLPLWRLWCSRWTERYSWNGCWRF